MASNKKFLGAGLLALTIALVLLPPFKSFVSQVSLNTGVACIQVYQSRFRPLISGVIGCRYRPTCSEYGIEALSTHGLSRGGWLTLKRVCSCTQKVPWGTYDPVPGPVSPVGRALPVVDAGPAGLDE
jgi:putative membrane protein insertion efficiency factor